MMRNFSSCFSPNNIVRTIQSVRMSWMFHVARVGDDTDTYKKYIMKV
jgi:hypothetical protein